MNDEDRKDLEAITGVPIRVFHWLRENLPGVLLLTIILGWFVSYAICFFLFFKL